MILRNQITAREEKRRLNQQNKFSKGLQPQSEVALHVGNILLCFEAILVNGFVLYNRKYCHRCIMQFERFVLTQLAFACLL